MFERFTERARQVVVLAQDEARAFKHNYIGSEHVLLGLLREENGLGCYVLTEAGLTVAHVRVRVAEIVGEGDKALEGQIPFTPRAKKGMELALREALSLGHNYIGTEHLLLGLLRESDGVAARILEDFDLDHGRARELIFKQLQTIRQPAPWTTPSGREVPGQIFVFKAVRAATDAALAAGMIEVVAKLREAEILLLEPE